MGKYSTQLVLNTDTPITKLRGKVFRIENRMVLPINHPAAALYTPSRFGILKEDFQRIKMILDNYENLGTIAGLGDLVGADSTGMAGATGSFGLEAASLLSDSNSSINAEKGPAVSAEPDLQKSKNEQLGLF